LLLTSPSELKEMLMEAIRRHGVTLKGSKHGSRCVLQQNRLKARLTRPQDLVRRRARPRLQGTLGHRLHRSERFYDSQYISDRRRAKKVTGCAFCVQMLYFNTRVGQKVKEFVDRLICFQCYSKCMCDTMCLCFALPESLASCLQGHIALNDSAMHKSRRLRQYTGITVTQ
jgi:hypothetical protein